MGVFLCVCVSHFIACAGNQTFSQGQKILKSEDIMKVLCLVSGLWSQRTKIPETRCKNVLMLCFFTSVKTEVQRHFQSISQCHDIVLMNH